MAIEYHHHKRLFRDSAPGRVLMFGVQGDTQDIVGKPLDADRDNMMASQRDFLNQYCDAAIHVGDVVDDPNDVTKFAVAREFWSDGLRIPYIVSPGNWDMGTVALSTSDPQIPHYTRFLQDDGHARLQLVTLTTNWTDGQTATLGATTYRLKNTMTAANDVQIGASPQESMRNLTRAINADPTSSGTSYHASTTANAEAYADMTWRTDVIQFQVYGRPGHGGNTSASTSNGNAVWVEDGLTTSIPMSTAVGYGGVTTRDWFVEYDGSFRRWAIAFERQGIKWLFVSLPFGPTSDDMAWGDAIVKRAAYTDHWVTLVCHSVIFSEEGGKFPTQFNQVGGFHAPDDTNFWTKVNGYPGATTPAAYKTNISVGQEMWDSYLSTWRNLKFCFNGHHWTSGTPTAGYRTETGAAGQRVHFFHCDYQGVGNTGADDWEVTMRLLRMVEASGVIEVRSYDPYHDVFHKRMWEDFRIADAEVWTAPT